MKIFRFWFICLLLTVCGVRSKSTQLAKPEKKHVTDTKNQMLLMIGGGWVNKGAYKKSKLVVGLHPDGTWVPKAFPPESFFQLSASHLPDGRVIALGGWAGYDSNNTYIYDVLKDKWTEGPTINTPRLRLCSASVDGKVYAIGGCSGELLTGNLDTLDSVEVLDLNKGGPARWEYVSPMHTARAGAAAVVFRGDIHVTGGWGLNTGEKYIAKQDRWEPLPSMSYRRHYHGLVTLNNRMYAVGGYDSTTSTVLNTVEVFDGLNWRAAPSLREARYAAAVGVLDQKIYVAGGEGLYTGWQPIYSVEIFDPSTSKWSFHNYTESSSPLPIFYSASIVVDVP